MSRNKSILLYLATSSFIFLLALEGLLYYFMNFHQQEKFMKPEEFVIDQQQVEKLKPSFHALYGWVYPHKTVSGERPIPQVKQDDGLREIFSFGDSFVFGHKVLDHEAWSAALSQKLKTKVWNYGVPAYGLDQAYLRLKDHKEQIKDQVVIYGFIGECLTRSLNIFPRFRKKRFELTLTKPHYSLEQGAPFYHPNPIQRVEDVARLADTEFIKSLGGDFFFPTAHKFNHFPRFTSLLKPEFWNHVRTKFPLNTRNQSLERSMWHRPEAVIGRQLLKEVRNVGAEAGSRVIVIVFPSKEEVLKYKSKGKLPDYSEVLPSWSKEDGFELVDLIFELKNFTEEEIQKLYLEHDPHLSPKGNNVVANYLSGILAPIVKKN